MKQLSEFVKERRKEVNLTQEEFAERAGVALTVVRKIEQGKTNYVGHLIIEKERSTQHVSVSLFNRMAKDMTNLKSNITSLLALAPLTSGIGVRDDFFEQLNNTDGK